MVQLLKFERTCDDTFLNEMDSQTFTAVIELWFQDHIPVNPRSLVTRNNRSYKIWVAINSFFLVPNTLQCDVPCGPPRQRLRFYTKFFDLWTRTVSDQVWDYHFDFQLEYWKPSIVYFLSLTLSFCKHLDLVIYRTHFVFSCTKMPGTVFFWKELE